MIIVNLTGGLGNQMFQYALGKALSLEKNTELLIDTRNIKNVHNGFELDLVFDIKAKIAERSDFKAVLGYKSNPVLLPMYSSRKKIWRWLNSENCLLERHHYYDESISNTPDNLFIKGYWQSEKYFLNHKNDILKTFLFNQNISDKNQQIIKAIERYTSISIHIRRGDHLLDPHGSTITPLNYYKNAISQLTTQSNNILYVIFSDSINWVRQHFIEILEDEKYIIIDNNTGKESYNDMRLMSLCNHNIIANSSFSWWGAWLNQNPDKVVMIPQKWFPNLNINTTDVCPESWKVIN